VHGLDTELLLRDRRSSFRRGTSRRGGFLRFITGGLKQNSNEIIQSTHLNALQFSNADGYAERAERDPR
jgi:hypothetical protein